MIFKILIKLTLATLFFICLTQMPYDYYMILRVVSSLFFLLLSYYEWNDDKKPLGIFWFYSAILMNPIAQVHLGRFLWNIVDVIWSIILLITAFFDFKNR